MVMETLARPSNGLTIVTMPKWDDLLRRMRQYDPKSELGKIVKACFGYLPPELAGELLERITSSVIVESMLSVVVIRHPDSPSRRGGPLIEDHGVVSRKVVTTAGVGYIVDAFANGVELENMKYHALGTSSQAEAAGDTGCVAELSTEYTGNARATGTTEEGASANIYKTVATNTLDESATVEEHAIMSQAATGGGVCLDRSLTGTQTLSASDGLQSTYQLTLSSGG